MIGPRKYEHEASSPAAYPIERMRDVIQRLFKERTPEAVTLPGVPQDVAPQSPAIECHVILKSGYRTQGALSTTPEGTLRLLAPAQIQTSQTTAKPVMAEHFFDYADVEVVVVMHDIEPSLVNARSGLIVPGRG